MSVTPQATDTPSDVYSKMIALGYSDAVAQQIEDAFTAGRA